MKTTRRLSLSLFAATLSLAASRDADAQLINRFSLRGEAGAGIMTPTLQRNTLGYDEIGRAHV